jgi:SAM-dependent methyltransferase
MTDPVIAIDRIITFYDYLRVDGWTHARRDELNRIEIAYGDEIVHTERDAVRLPHPRVGRDPAFGFVISCILPDTQRADLRLKLHFARSGEVIVDLTAHSEMKMHEARAPFERFFEGIPSGAAVLEIGSRARSGRHLRERFTHTDYVGVDILDGPNVDVVADAHDLATKLGTNRFDRVLTISTFEHLAMPWKAVVEINKVLKTGGLAFVQTHQTCGMHDLPWDFWRFSTFAFDALFNPSTGFELVEAEHMVPMHIVPFYGRAPHWVGAEGAAGFYQSHVVARKTSDTTLSWDVSLDDVVRMNYPA